MGVSQAVLVRRAKGTVWRWLDRARWRNIELERSVRAWQWEEPAHNLAVQRGRLESLLRHAYQHVPYYREALGDVGVIDPDGKVELDRFTRIPLLDRETLRGNAEALRSTDLDERRWWENFSGGSTGEPVRFIQDRTYAEWSRTIKGLFDEWTGYQAGLGLIFLWGSERDLLVGQELLRHRVGRWLRSELWQNAFQMDAQRMRTYLAQLNTFRPTQIRAYVEAIYELARFAEREGISIQPPGGIVTAAGTLFDPMRETIERVFRAPVYNNYGSREVGSIACECSHRRGLHIAIPTHYLEILRPDGSLAAPGEVGEVVVTSLSNYAMPLIRYRIGDVAAMAEEGCGCGRGWPCLREVVGRTADVFRRADGGIIVPQYLIGLIHGIVDTSWIRKYQVIQEQLDLVRLLVVSPQSSERGDPANQAAITELGRILRLALGEECQVRVEFVDEIPPTASGKYRYTISQVGTHHPPPSLAGRVAVESLQGARRGGG
jgi:phenylacetate-CoA ligase